MIDTQDLIDKINTGDMADAGKAFQELMGSKIQNALDDRKVELGNQMHLSPEELEELESAELEDEDFEEDEDIDDDEIEEDEVEDDDDVQPTEAES